MKALILNSGLGSRMGVETKEHPKCMTDITDTDTILSRQLRQLVKVGIQEVVITTGLFADKLQDYCRSLGLPLQYTFVHNPKYAVTNYIYSIYMAREVLEEDILLLHGDLVFALPVLQQIMNNPVSCMAVSSTVPLPEKDFKAVVENERITKVGIEFFDNALTAQPLYKLLKVDWLVWLQKINEFCETGQTNCYAEKAFNEVSDKCRIFPVDVRDALCNEIDNLEDLAKMRGALQDGK